MFELAVSVLNDLIGLASLDGREDLFDLLWNEREDLRAHDVAGIERVLDAYCPMLRHRTATGAF